MSSYLWILEAVIGIFVVLGLQYGLKKIFGLVRKGKIQSLDQILQPPMTLILWVFGVVYIMDVVGDHFGLKVVVGYLHPFRKAVFIGSFAWALLRWKGEYQKSLSVHHKVDLSTREVIGRLSTIAILVLTGLIILQTLGIDTAPLLAFGSIGAASIGFAGKDVIANFCGGMILHITKPFVIGDLIFLPEKQLEGHIEEIGWFRTAIRDRDKRPVYLPNNFFSTMLVVNISRMTHRRIKQTIQIDFQDASKISDLTEKIREGILAHPTIDISLPVSVYFSAFAQYGCEIGIEVYSKEIDYGRFHILQQELLLKVQEVVASYKIEMATPKSFLIQR